MNKRQAQTAFLLRGARRFLDSRPALAGAINAPATRAEVDETLASFDRLAAQQAEAHRRGVDETRTRRVRVEQLRNHHLRPITAIGRAYLEFPLNRFHVPPARDNAQFIALYARQVMGAARPHADVFVQNGLAPDFLGRLNEAILRVEQSLQATATAAHEQRGATEALQHTKRRAHDLIAVLDALIAPRLVEDLDARTAWESCTRLGGGGHE